MIDFLLDEIRGPLIVTSRGTKKQAIVRTIITEEKIPEEKLALIAGKFPVIVFGPGKLVEIYAFRQDRNFAYVVYDSDLYLQNEEDEHLFVIEFNDLIFGLETKSNHGWNFELTGKDSDLKIKIYHPEPKIPSEKLIQEVLSNTCVRKIK
jgi:hypothetical protein